MLLWRNAKQISTALWCPMHESVHSMRRKCIGRCVTHCGDRRDYSHKVSGCMHRSQTANAKKYIHICLWIEHVSQHSYRFFEFFRWINLHIQSSTFKFRIPVHIWSPIPDCVEVFDRFPDCEIIRRNLNSGKVLTVVLRCISFAIIIKKPLLAKAILLMNLTKVNLSSSRLHFQHRYLSTGVSSHLGSCLFFNIFCFLHYSIAAFTLSTSHSSLWMPVYPTVGIVTRESSTSHVPSPPAVQMICYVNLSVGGPKIGH